MAACRRDGRKRILAAAVFVAAGLILYPAASAAGLTLRQIEAADRYRDETAGSYAGEKQEAEIKRAQAYNEALYRKRRTEPYRYSGEEATDPEYEACLNANGILCVLEIPTIGLTVPVVHGTRSGDLQNAAGHFYGTSLPVGGGSTHAGIAAHSGLPNAKLFSELEDLGSGDVFYIHILNQSHIYRIDGRLVVEPQEADQYMQIEEGEDRVTLYTCTPYGLNTHRLLVRAVRDPEAEEAMAEAELSAGTKSKAEQRERLRAAAFRSRALLAGVAAGLTLSAFTAAVVMKRSGSPDRYVTDRERGGTA